MRKIIMLFVCTLALASTSSLNASLPISHEPDPKTVRAAIAEFKNLPKSERKERIKEAKKELKQLKKDRRNGKDRDVEKAVLIILAILLPPLAVYLHQGEINGKFWLSILLWLLFILPGIIYALLVVLDEV